MTDLRPRAAPSPWMSACGCPRRPRARSQGSFEPSFSTSAALSYPRWAYAESRAFRDGNAATADETTGRRFQNRESDRFFRLIRLQVAGAVHAGSRAGRERTDRQGDAAAEDRRGAEDIHAAQDPA